MIIMAMFCLLLAIHLDHPLQLVKCTGNVWILAIWILWTLDHIMSLLGSHLLDSFTSC